MVTRDHCAGDIILIDVVNDVTFVIVMHGPSEVTVILVVLK